MSTSRTKYSSQRPATRAPPAGSSKSGSRRSGYGSGEIPLSAATSSSSSTSASSEDEPRRSHANSARKAPSLCPSDSVSRVKPHPRQSSSGQSSDRRGSRASGSAWRSSKSRGSRASTGRGTVWSGSGSALTEENLEKLQSRSRLDSVAETAEESYSNQQEGAQSSRRQYEQRTSARSTRRETIAQTTNRQPQGRTSRRYGAATTQDAYQKDANAPGSKAESHSRSRKDSLSPEGALPVSKGAAQDDSSARSQQQSASNATSEQDASGGGWQRKVIVTTKRWPDGREVREREVRMIRTPQTLMRNDE